MHARKGLQNVLRKMTRLRDKLRAPRWMRTMKDVREQLTKETATNFLESRSPDGEPWPALKYRVGMPLVKTGDMMQKVVTAVQQAEIGEGFLLVRIPQPSWIAVHQFGSRDGRIPQRKFIGFSNVLRKRAVKLLRSEVIGFMLGGDGYGKAYTEHVE